MVVSAETRPDIEFAVASQEIPEVQPEAQETIESLHMEKISTGELIDAAETMPWEIYIAFGEEVAKKVFGKEDNKEMVASGDGLYITHTGVMLLPGSVSMPRINLLLTQPTRFFIENNKEQFIGLKLGMPIKDPDAWREVPGGYEDDLPESMSIRSIKPDTFRSRSRSVKHPNSLKGSRIVNLQQRGYSDEQIDRMSDSELADLSDVGKKEAEEIPTYTGVRLLTGISQNVAGSYSKEPGVRLEASVQEVTEDLLNRSLASVQEGSYSRIMEEASPALFKLLSIEGDARGVGKSKDTETYLGSVLYYKGHLEKFRPVIVSDELIVLADRKKAIKETAILLKKEKDGNWKGDRFEIGKDTEFIDEWVKKY